MKKHSESLFFLLHAEVPNYPCFNKSLFLVVPPYHLPISFFLSAILNTIGPVAELKNSAAGFLVSKAGRIMKIARKFAGAPPNRYSKSNASDFLAPVWRIFWFLRAYEIIFIDTRDWSLPCSRFIHSFFKSVVCFAHFLQLADKLVEHLLHHFLAASSAKPPGCCDPAASGPPAAI